MTNNDAAVRPLERVLEEAACRYWEVEPGFFRLKCRDGHTDKRRVLFWLLYSEADMTYSGIARRYGYSQQSVHDGIKKIEVIRTVINNIARDVSNIKRLAGPELNG